MYYDCFTSCDGYHQFFSVVKLLVGNTTLPSCIVRQGLETDEIYYIRRLLEVLLEGFTSLYYVISRITIREGKEICHTQRVFSQNQRRSILHISEEVWVLQQILVPLSLELSDPPWEVICIIILHRRFLQNSSIT